MTDSVLAAAPLAPAPAGPLDANGRPRFGAYAGWLATTSLAGLRPPVGKAPSRVARFFAEKRWLHVGVYDEQAILSLAIVDVGYLATAWSFLWDRRARRLVSDESAILAPGLLRVSDDPRGGARARGLGLDLRFTVEPGAVPRGRLVGRQKNLGIDVTIELGRPALAALCEVDEAGAGVDVTHKAGALPATGEVRTLDGATRVRFERALAAVDHTHGLLPREVEWRWVSLHGRDSDGRPIGLNLTEGFTDRRNDENAAFVDTDGRGVRPLKVGKARVTPGADPRKDPWHIATSDGAVDLTFTPEAARGEDTDLKLVVSRYVQPIGTFRGTIAGRRVDGAPGVTELHRARW